jgi:small GTP-binding protein
MSTERYNNKKNYEFKIVFAGDSGTGKTSFVEFFVYKKIAGSDSIPTIGANFFINHLQINDIRIKLQIWDTAGQERYRSLCKMYFNGSAGCFCVFSVMDYTSFLNLDKWITDYKERNNSSVIIVIGNKIDYPENEWKVPKHTIEKYIQDNKLDIVYTSGKNGTGITEAFELIGKRILTSDYLNASNNNNNRFVVSMPDESKNIGKKENTICCF